ncbi:MAG: UDP-N-acetylmuramate dehydrogenase [bacterium]|nr:UDP-N-acetylmuramate dehydrogenase [bacterium]
MNMGTHGGTEVTPLEEKFIGLACEIRFCAPLSEFNTFQIGGPADAIALPRNERELVEVLEVCRAEEIPITLLGAGANTLVLDGGVRGMVISLARGFREFTLSPEEEGVILLEAEAGVKSPQLARFAAERWLSGLEALIGVPGTIGGALAMNAGTSERYMGESVESIRWIRLRAGEAERLPAGALAFAYREARLPEPGIVVGVRFRLRRADPESLMTLVQRNAEYRKDRQPSGVPCAGSIFRNPPGDHAGRIIEAAGLKGRRVGGAEVSQVHANFLVNAGGATAADVLALIEEVRGEVKTQTGIELRLELKMIGESAS